MDEGKQADTTIDVIWAASGCLWLLGAVVACWCLCVCVFVVAVIVAQNPQACQAAAAVA